MSDTKENYGSGTPFPAGAYQMMTKDAEVCETRDRNGKYLKLTFEVTKGDHEKRLVFHNFNFVNSNPKAVEIGLGQIRAMLRLGGHDPDTFDDEKLDDFNGIKLDCKVKVRKDDQWGDSNEIKTFGELGKFTNKKISDPVADDNSLATETGETPF